jgi:uncharacterized DUF497 family protein
MYRISHVDVDDKRAQRVSDTTHAIDAVASRSSEERFITFGVSARGRLLIVAHTDSGDTIRIISARSVTAGERRIYEEGQEG